MNMSYRSAEMVVSNTPDLTPIVLSQLQTTTKMKEENRKLRRGSRYVSINGNIIVNLPEELNLKLRINAGRI